MTFKKINWPYTTSGLSIPEVLDIGPAFDSYQTRQVADDYSGVRANLLTNQVWRKVEIEVSKTADQPRRIVIGQVHEERVEIRFFYTIRRKVLPPIPVPLHWKNVEEPLE